MASETVKNCVLKINPKVYCCRICLDTKYSKGINLSESPHVLKLLEYCVGFTVNIEYTSHVLCVQCKQKIEEVKDFKRQCEKSETFWKKYPIAKNSKFGVVQNHSDLSTFIKQEKTETDQECEELNTEGGFEDFNEISYNTENFTLPPVMINNEVETYSKNNKDKLSEVNCEDNTKTYKCTKCKRKYSTHKSLLSHKRKRHCKGNVTSNTNKHKRSVTTENENVKLSTNECGLCDTPLSCDVSEHLLNNHWLNNNLQCDLCDYCGKDFAHMVTHRYTHCPHMKLYCTACNKRSFSMLALQFHFRSVHLQKPGGYCTFCDKTFNKFKTWKKHHRMHTETNKLYVCDHCGRKFLYRHEIKTHLISHSDSRQYVCENCGKGFRRASSLREHVYNIHETRQPVKCEHCNRVYKCENKLRIHLRNVAAEKPFICEVCSKTFRTETVLKKHMFWHTNERPFSCEVCGSKYKAKAELKVHMRKHSGELPYVCAVCFKSFRSSSQLKIHSSVHTGIRRHKCTHCEKSFHCKKTLLLHTAQHKNVEGVKMEPKCRV